MQVQQGVSTAQQQLSLLSATDDTMTASATTQGGRQANQTWWSAALLTTTMSRMHDRDGGDGDCRRFDAGVLWLSSPAAAAASISDDDADVADGNDNDGGGDAVVTLTMVTALHLSIAMWRQVSIVTLISSTGGVLNALQLQSATVIPQRYTR